ncbi:hypothetical protein PSN45_001278 [Yamadazyma tenuis]|uniref:uncharacterized protein n=1 Tax=Candida tenuis TaxID=2315449 RepID=UPI0027A49A7C|nr:hypothetical protein PSN45_001278 [Yamadazyma tenuis]
MQARMDYDIVQDRLVEDKSMTREDGLSILKVWLLLRNLNMLLYDNQFVFAAEDLIESLGQILDTRFAGFSYIEFMV